MRKKVRLFNSEDLEVEGGLTMSNDKAVTTYKMVVHNHMYFMLQTKSFTKTDPTSGIEEESEWEFLRMRANQKAHPDMPEQTIFNLHHETYFLEKVVTSKQKLLYTVGKDYNDDRTKEGIFLKMWNIESLIDKKPSCKSHYISSVANLTCFIIRCEAKRP